jgi:nucleotide-binding universal stress UspA family protein
MTTATPPTGFLHLVVGYDGSPPASRALDGAARLLQGRIGRIDVVYVAYLSSLAALSPGAIAQVEETSTRSSRSFAPAAGQPRRAA